MKSFWNLTDLLLAAFLPPCELLGDRIIIGDVFLQMMVIHLFLRIKRLKKNNCLLGTYHKIYHKYHSQVYHDTFLELDALNGQYVIMFLCCFSFDFL